MKRRKALISLLTVMLICTAFRCESFDEEPPPSLPCRLTNVELHHWDNAGKTPETPSAEGIPREAYMLEITILTDAGSKPDETVSPFPVYELEEDITSIRIFMEKEEHATEPRETDVTDHFKDYPRFINPDQTEDLTASKSSIRYVKSVNRIYKALLTVPEPGTYRFRVELILGKGNRIERDTQPITLY